MKWKHPYWMQRKIILEAFICPWQYPILAELGVLEFDWSIFFVYNICLKNYKIILLSWEKLHDFIFMSNMTKLSTAFKIKWHILNRFQSLLWCIHLSPWKCPWRDDPRDLFTSCWDAPYWPTCEVLCVHQTKRVRPFASLEGSFKWGSLQACGPIPLHP